jgi:hypothetical protein
MKATVAVTWGSVFLFVFYVVCIYWSSPLFSGLLYLLVPVVLITMGIIILKEDRRAESGKQKA